MADIAKIDLYELLEILPSATEKEIVRAYRKKALKCHPDKNPDDAKAADKFHQLTKALEVLTDEAARAAYDKVLKAKEAAKIRHKELDSKRKKFKEDLEAREKQSEQQQTKTTQFVDTKKLEAEIARLRKAGSKLLEEEQERLKEELKKEIPVDDEEEEATTVAPRLKVKWKSKKSDDTNGGYTEEYLEKIFSKYGTVTALIISSKKKGSAILEYASPHSAVLAVQHEIGLPTNQLTLSWISGEPASSCPDFSGGEPIPSTDNISKDNLSKSTFPCFGNTPVSGQNPGVDLTNTNDRDFESIVLMKMRQAQERKKLIEEMEKNDGKDTG